MNLVAKEYVACRSDLGGALVLSEFAGAADELRQAYLVNPHDLDGVKDVIEAAMNQTPEEGRRRMRALRRQVLIHDVDLVGTVIPGCPGGKAGLLKHLNGVDKPPSVEALIVDLDPAAVVEGLS